LDIQIEYLKGQIEALEADSSESTRSPTNFSELFNITSFIRASKYRSSTLEDSNLNISFNLFIEDSFQRVRDKISNLDSLKFRIKQQGKSLYEVIEPYFRDTERVKSYVNQFFELELYSYFAYMSKARFHELFYDFFSLKRESFSATDYVFMGQLLMIMRITAVSLYNGGYSNQEETLGVSPEAFNLAHLCFEEANVPLYSQSLDTLRLVMLMFEYETHAPETLDLQYRRTQSNVLNLVRAGVDLKFNIDPLDSVDSQFIRVIWHQILDIERTNLIYHGFSSLTEPDTYTTSLPLLKEVYVDEFDDLILKRFHDRTDSFKELILRISKMITNARNPSSLEDFEILMEELIEQCNLASLESILSPKSRTKEQRCTKVFKFIDFLDLHCASFMLALSIFMYYDNQIVQETKAIEDAVRIGSAVLPLAYFLDPHQQHYYNLREHFGHSIQLIPKIIHILHRVIILQYILLIKCCCQNNELDSKLSEIKRRIFQNIKVIISSFGKVSENYLHARRLYMVHSYLVIKFFGLNGETFVTSFKNKTFSKLNEENKLAILDNLIELRGDTIPLEYIQGEQLVTYFESLISESNIKLTEPFSLEKIDQFLASIDLSTFT
jgi:hypothetical protein